MTITTKPAFVVDGLPGGSKSFDRQRDAEQAVTEYLEAFDARLTPARFKNSYGDWSGEIGVRWYEDEVPASPFDALVAEYAGEPHGFSTEDALDEWHLDAADAFLLVEENVRGGYWLTSGSDIEDLMDYHFNQEYAEEWSVIGIFDTATGEEVQVEVSRSYKVTK